MGENATHTSSGVEPSSAPINRLSNGDGGGSKSRGNNNNSKAVAAASAAKDIRSSRAAAGSDVGPGACLIVSC